MMLTVRLVFFWETLTKAFKKFLEDNAFVSAAALSYYTIFSLPPMLLVILFTTTLFYDPDTVRQTIFGELADVIGRDSAVELAKTVGMIGLFEGKWWSTLIGISALLFTSTTVFVTIQDTLNKMFMVKPKPDAGWWKMLRDRIISFALLLSIAFILIVSLMINALVAGLSKLLFTFLPGISILFIAATSFILPFIIITCLFTLIFKYLPDVRLPWKSVRVGGIFTTVLFFIGMYFIEFYISNSNTANLYQAAGSVMVIMVWVFYASVIFLFGAAFTFSYNEKTGHIMPAEDYAIKVINQEIEINNPRNSPPENKTKL
jgi:membrane protein